MTPEQEAILKEKFPDAQFVAEVKLYIDMKAERSSSTWGRLGGTSMIVLAPNGIDKIKTKKHFFSVLAHELGHWITYQQESPVNDPYNHFMHRMTGDGGFLLPSEHEAWNWAEKILPGQIDQEKKREALRTYGDTPQHARLI